MKPRSITPEGVEIKGPEDAETTLAMREILTPEALTFLAQMHRLFDERRRDLLQLRIERQPEIDAEKLPDFPRETFHIRNSEWVISPVPEDLQDRRVEITGPVDRKMVINALNSGANVFMADFEDSNAPTWKNVVQGQVNLRDAVKGSIQHTGPEGKDYALNKKDLATLMVRPRGWHLTENHLLVDGQPMSASLFDFGLYFFHNVEQLLRKGSGPYFYLPKMECHREARLWNDVFVFAQGALDIPQGTIKATVLIETIMAAFEMDEILFELREHSAGLNCGRWDYIFSCIKKFRNRPDFILADRALITMETHFMRSYSQLAIQTCHRRQAHAIGGMAAQIPIKENPAANDTAMAKVRADKEREVRDGHDGTWVAHPGLVPLAREVFDRHMKTPNQINLKREDLHITKADLLSFGPEKPITEAGLRTNIRVAIQYLGSWLGGQGCVPIANLMEDAATAEISRSQIWNWIQNPKGVLEDGRRVTPELVRAMIPQERENIRKETRESSAFTQYDEAAQMLEKLALGPDFVDFLTLPGYQMLLKEESRQLIHA